MGSVDQRCYCGPVIQQIRLKHSYQFHQLPEESYICIKQHSAALEQVLSVVAIHFVSVVDVENPAFFPLIIP